MCIGGIDNGVGGFGGYVALDKLDGLPDGRTVSSSRLFTRIFYPGLWEGMQLHTRINIVLKTIGRDS